MEREETDLPVVEYSLDEYQQQAITLAVYPEQYQIAYPALGVFEEIGEMMEVDTEAEGFKDTLMKEMGDVMWYVSATAYDLGLSLSDCYHNPDTKIMDDIEALYVNSYRLAGRVKKILRGDDGREEKVMVVRGLLGDIIRRLIAIGLKYEFTLMEVCEMNLDKLFDRKDRGQLKGDGDNR